MDVLSDQGIRMDGRRPNELRKIECKLGVCPGTDGSAYMQHGHTKVLVSVYGPHDITSRRAMAPSDKAVINCQYRTAPFSGNIRNKASYGDKRAKDMSHTLRNVFESAILTSLYPGSQIDIFFLVLYSDGGILSSCINAGSLAVINAGIPMKDYLCACSAGFANETPLMDINHLEGFMGGVELNMAILRKSEVIVCDELVARIHRDLIDKLRKMVIQGCKDMYAVLDVAVRRYAVQNQSC